MATKQGSRESGKLGNVILYTVDGRQCVRSMPVHVANPRTEAQQAHRSAFVEIVRLSSRMTDAHTIGLHRHAQRQHLRTYMDFRKLNKDCFTPDGDIDYPRIVLSRGSVPPVYFNSARFGKRHLLHLTYDPDLQAGNANATDELYLFAYSPAHCSGLLYVPVPRATERLTLQLPSDWFPPTPSSQAFNQPSTQTFKQSNNQAIQIHLYAFLRNRRGYTSDTIYIPLATCSTSDRFTRNKQDYNTEKV